MAAQFRGVNFEIVMNPEEYPAEVRAEIETRFGSMRIPKAFFFRDTVWIDAGRVRPSEVPRTVLHEVIGHNGLRLLFPNDGKLNSILDNIYREHFNEPLFDRVAELNFPTRERVAEIDPETGETLGSGRISLETEEDQRIAAEEYVARIAETKAPKPNWWKEFLQSIRMWMAEHLPFTREVRMTDREIETLLARSARAARRRRRNAGRIVTPDDPRFAAALRREGAPNTAGERNQLRDGNVPHSAGFMERNRLQGNGIYADYEFLYGRHPEYFSSPEEVRAVVEFVLDDPEPAGRINGNLTFVRQDVSSGKFYRIEINPKVSGNRNQIRSAHEITEAQYKKRENRLTRDDDAASPDSVRQGENAKASEHPNVKNPDSRKAGTVADFLRSNITSSGEKSSGGILFLVNENGETIFGISGRRGDFTAREILEDGTISENTPILTSEGSEVWGEITPEMAEAGKELGLEALPIKLLKGKHFGNHAGFGLAHLWNQHGAELEARGYDLSDFLTGIFGKPNQIYASKQGDNIRLELVTKSMPRNLGVLELRKEKGFYSVVTAFPIEKDSHQFRGNKIWTYEGSAHTKSKQRTQSLEPLSGDQRLQPPLEDRGIQTNNNITSSGEKSRGKTGARFAVEPVENRIRSARKIDHSSYQENTMLAADAPIPVISVPLERKTVSGAQAEIAAKIKDGNGKFIIRNLEQNMPVAIISHGSLDEAGSGKAVSETTSDGTPPEIHAAALHNIEPLLAHARLGASHRDWHVYAKNERYGTNREIAVQIHRFYSAMRYGDAVYGVKMTVREKRSGATVFYTLEAHNLEIAELRAENSSGQKNSPDAEATGESVAKAALPGRSPEIQFSAFFEKFKPVEDLLGFKYKENYPDVLFSASEFSADEESDIVALLRPFVGPAMTRSDAEIVDYLRRHGVEAINAALAQESGM